VKLNDLDFNKLAVFCQIVESGNYSRAAEVLHVTPSALSQTISLLEHRLGFPLFHRTGRKLIPTSSGLKLHKEFRFHQGGFLESVKHLAQKQHQITGILRVGSYLEFATSQLAPVVRSFSQKFPETQLKISFDTPTRLQSALEKGQFDLCFSIYPSLSAKKTVESRPVFHEELVLVSPMGMLSDTPSLHEILEAPLIEYFANHQPMARWLQLHFRKRPKKLPVRVYASAAEMVLALVAEGLGIGVVPQFLLDSTRLKRGVKLVRPSPRRLLDHIWMLENRVPHTALHEEFRKHVLSSLQ